MAMLLWITCINVNVSVFAKYVIPYFIPVLPNIRVRLNQFSTLSSILHWFPVSGTFLWGKKQFLDGQNSTNFLGDQHIFKMRIVN